MSVSLRKSRPNPLNPVEIDRRSRMHSRGEKIFEKSTRGRRNKGRTHSLRKEIYNKPHHTTELRADSLRNSGKTRIEDTRHSIRRRILREILGRTKDKGSHRVKGRSQRMERRSRRRNTSRGRRQRSRRSRRDRESRGTGVKRAKERGSKDRRSTMGIQRRRNPNSCSTRSPQ